MLLGGGVCVCPMNRGLREFHFGAWEGRHFSDVAAQDPDLSRAYWDRPGDVCAPWGGKLEHGGGAGQWGC